MKTTILLLLMAVASSALADKYTDLMTKAIGAVYDAKSVDEYQAAINTFNRIGDAEKNKWEPFYYAAFGYIMIAVDEQDGAKKDSFLDLAKTALAKASTLRPEDSEITAMEGFIYMIRTSVDPATRGPEYSMKAMQSFGKAVALNPQNPRALGLMAQMQLGMANFFKQEPTEACETARKALAAYTTDSNGNALAPKWGKGMTESVVKNCK